MISISQQKENFDLVFDSATTLSDDVRAGQIGVAVGDVAVRGLGVAERTLRLDLRHRLIKAKDPNA